MQSNKSDSYKINNELYRLSIPLNKSEYAVLEEKILSKKSKECFYVWNNKILTDFESYNICIKNKLDFDVIKLKFNTIHEAVIWVCNKILKNDSPSQCYRNYLIGKLCDATKKQYTREYMYSLHNKIKNKSIGNKDFHTEIYESIAAEYKISDSTVRLYFLWAEGIDRFYNISEKFVIMVLKDEFKISQENLISFSKCPENKIKEVLGYIFSDGTKKNFIDYKFMLKKDTPINKSPIDVKVKTMPKHDPDAELSSLTFTVPSWTSSLERTYNATDFNVAGKFVKETLSQKLTILKHSIDIMLCALEG